MFGGVDNVVQKVYIHSYLWLDECGKGDYL